MTNPESRPVAVGVTGTPASSGALRYAVDRAVQEHTWLQLVHVVPPYPPLGPVAPIPILEMQGIGADIVSEAADTVRGLAPGLPVRRVVHVGDRAAGLVQSGEAAQLVVLGHESRQGLLRLLGGAVTAVVAAHSPCPVAVVPSDWTPKDRHDHVVVGIKSRDHADELLGFAFALAAERGARLTVLTAWELPDPYLDRIELRTHADAWVEDGTKVLEELCADWRTAYPEVRVELRIEHGHPASVLVAAAESADELVVARPRRALLPHDRLGSTVHGVLRGAAVPVLVVPTGRRQAHADHTDHAAAVTAAATTSVG